MGTRRWLVLVACCLSMLLVGCRDVDDTASLEVVDILIQASAEGERAALLPRTTSAHFWTHRAFEKDHRGFSYGAQGQNRGDLSRPLKATLRYTVFLLPRPQGATLRVDADLQLETLEASPNLTLLMASRQMRHEFLTYKPEDHLLRPLATLLLEEAIVELVDELRDQAVVLQAPPEDLPLYIYDESLAPTARHRAVQRAGASREVPLDEPLRWATHHGDHLLAIAAARALLTRGSPEAPQALLRVALQLSRDRLYDEYLPLLPLLHSLEVPWIDLYLETVADGHRVPRIRQRAQEVLVQRK